MSVLKGRLSFNVFPLFYNNRYDCFHSFNVTTNIENIFKKTLIIL